jgi:hypothetical protein
VATALEIGRRHQDGAPAVTGEDLDYRLGAVMADRVRTSLSGCGLFLDTDHGLLPARGVSSISVGDLVAAVIEGAPQEPEPSGPGAARTVSRVLALWREDPAILLTDDRVMGIRGRPNGSQLQAEVDGVT